MTVLNEIQPSVDEIFAAHEGGKLATGLSAPLANARDLAIAYTPGVAQVSRAIAADPALARRYTWADRLVAVVSDGTAVLGLGDIGPRAALPVMEGKSALFKAFGGLDSIPIVLDTTDVDEIVETLVRLRPSFGAVNLEDVAAPRCFEMERRLIEALDCPVMHDDQHGTAIVVLAALRGACAVQGRRARGLAGRGVRRGRGGRRLRPDPARRGRRTTSSSSTPAACSTRARRDGEKAALAARDQPARRHRRDRRRAGGRRRVRRPLRWHRPRGAALARWRRTSIVFALSNPDPEMHPDVARRARGDRRHRAQRLPEPDQQRARLPRCLPRRARRARPGASPST